MAQVRTFTVFGSAILQGLASSYELKDIPTFKIQLSLTAMRNFFDLQGSKIGYHLLKPVYQGIENGTFLPK
jgi:hypothetical protein